MQDLIFNLSLRMLGTVQDAQDASQEILLKVMTHLSSYRGASAFSTWTFRIAAQSPAKLSPVDVFAAPAQL